MKKLISLIFSLSLPAFAQLINVQDPASKGLVRTIPYTSDWSQKWLTNVSVSSAAAQLAPFFNTNSTFGNINVTTVTDPYGVYPSSTNVALRNAAIVRDQYGALPSSTNIQTKSALLSAIYPYVVVNVDDVASNSGLSVNSVNSGYGTYVVMSNTAPDTTSTILASSGIYVSSNVVGSVTSYSVSNTIPQTILSQSTGITISSNLINGVNVFTVAASGTNQVSVTNLNAQTLSGYGALTTNAAYTTFQQLTNLGIVLTNTWQYYCDAANAYTNAKAYTNGLISSATAASTYLTMANASSTYLSQVSAALIYQPKGNYQPLGTYLTPSSSLDYNNVTNQPAPYTNFSTAFVGTLYSTNETATTLGATTANVATGNITNGNITTARVTTGYVTTEYVTNANLTTANIATANITNANITTLTVTNIKPVTVNVSSNLTTYNLAVTNAVGTSTNILVADTSGNVSGIALTNYQTSRTYFVDNIAILTSSGVTYSNTHSLGRVPSEFRVVLYCITNDGNTGYAVGDELPAQCADSGGPFFNYGINSTNIFITQQIGGANLILQKRTNGARYNFTAADALCWKLKVYYR